MVEDLKVRDAMTETIITVPKDETVLEAAKIMEKNHIGSLIVISGTSPIGILTESDVIKKVVSQNLSAADMKVNKVMSSPIIFSNPTEKLSDAAMKMIENRVRRLAVIERGDLVGIITHTDIARMMPSMITVLVEKVRMKGPDTPMVDRYSKKLAGGKLAGLCEACGNYSPYLNMFDEEWLCERCHKERTTSPGAKWQRKPGFRDWSRMA